MNYTGDRPTNTLRLPSGLAFYPGDVYAFTAEVTVVPGDASPGIVTGLEFPGLPAGYTAEIVDGCGALVEPYAVSDETASAPLVNRRSNAVPVTIAITATDTVSPDGTAWSLSGAGVKATPEGQIDPASVTCEPVIGGATA